MIKKVTRDSPALTTRLLTSAQVRQMLGVEKETNDSLAQTTRLVSYARVRQKLGDVSEAKLFDMIAKGLFPPPFELVPGGRAKRWLERTVDEWILARKAESEAKL